MPNEKSQQPAQHDNVGIKDERTQKRIHEHLSNKNDAISEEDISNIKTEIEEKDPENTNTEA